MIKKLIKIVLIFVLGFMAGVYYVEGVKGVKKVTNEAASSEFVQKAKEKGKKAASAAKEFVEERKDDAAAALDDYEH
jgi:hypothetical protein